MENKKSIFPMICVILLVVNLLLTGVIAFFTLPTNKKMNDLLTLIVDELNLDQDKMDGSKAIPMSQIVSVDIVDKIQGNLTSDTGSTKHMISITATITLNNKAKDYEKVLEQVTNNQVIIISDIRNTVTKYTYEVISPDNYAPILEKEVTQVLRERFDTEAIVGVYFKEYIHN